MARILSTLWTEEKWPYRWVSSEGASFIEARRSLLRAFWMVYVPTLSVVALLAAIRRELPPQFLDGWLHPDAFWLAVLSSTFGIPAVTLVAHARRIWSYSRERTGPGTSRVRVYTAFVVASAALMITAFLILCWLLVRS